jgi:hypothetical protein
MADMLALANKIGALPSRTKTMKELAETPKPGTSFSFQPA